MAVGQHPLVTSLIAGIFNSRSPQPRCIFVWDAQVVLNFLKKDWGISNSLTDQELTYKLCRLFSLTPTCPEGNFQDIILTLSWRRPLSYINQSIDLLHKSMDWFIYNNGLRHERVKTMIICFKRGRGGLGTRPWRFG